MFQCICTSFIDKISRKIPLEVELLKYSKLATPACLAEQTIEHILRDCPNLEAARQNTWPTPNSLWEKLWGLLASLAQTSSSLEDTEILTWPGRWKKKKKTRQRSTRFLVHLVYPLRKPINDALQVKFWSNETLNASRFYLRWTLKESEFLLELTIL